MIQMQIMMQEFLQINNLKDLTLKIISKKWIHTLRINLNILKRCNNLNNLLIKQIMHNKGNRILDLKILDKTIKIFLNTKLNSILQISKNMIQIPFNSNLIQMHFSNNTLMNKKLIINLINLLVMVQSHLMIKGTFQYPRIINQEVMPASIKKIKQIPQTLLLMLAFKMDGMMNLISLMGKMEIISINLPSIRKIIKQVIKKILSLIKHGIIKEKIKVKKLIK